MYYICEKLFINETFKTYNDFINIIREHNPILRKDEREINYANTIRSFI